MKNMYNLILSLLLIMILVSCSGSDVIFKDDSFDSPIPIAVLPFENQTTELAVSELARLFFIIGMEEKGYDVLPLAETDSLLMEMGITDGGQLSSVTYEELHNKLNVEGLLYGNVLDAKYSTLAVVSSKKVTIEIDVFRNGVKVWEDKSEKSTSAIGNILNPLKGLAEQVVNKAFEKAFAKYHGHPLEALTEEAIYELQDKMPGERVEKSGWN